VAWLKINSWTTHTPRGYPAIMAKRNTPVDGERFKRAVPSGNHKGKLKKQVRAQQLAALGKDRSKIKRNMGETIWTQELQDKMVQFIRAGNYAEVAARACGIDTKTFYNWLTRGGRGEEPFIALVQAVETATAEAEARDVLAIGKASDKHWQAAAWRLERKNAKRWGRKDALELSGDATKPIAVTVLKWADEEIEF
jgi:hypothetical protein